MAHWDFDESTFGTPARGEVALFVEVHVTHQETGGDGFTTVHFAPA